ncbi:MAG: hypothetical protein JW955_11370 [Sedimentisphaerales bacterium]|nr:hypothetical protein [Sedimentisphaerales bacterium]
MKRTMMLVAVLLATATQPLRAEDPVYFTDPDLKHAVEVRLGVTNPTPTQMLSLTKLEVGGIGSLTGLQYATNLEILYAVLGTISDISPLAGLTELHTLVLEANRITDVSALSGLKNLHVLDILLNPLDEAAYVYYIPLIISNNPGIALLYDERPTIWPDLVDGGEATRRFAPTTIAPGQPFEIETQILNRGGYRCRAFHVDYYASADTSITTSDCLLGRQDYSSIEAGGASGLPWSVAFPATVPNGTYYIGWIIDADNQVQETDESNNTAYKEGYRLTVQGSTGPVAGGSLTVTPPDAAAYSGPPGGPFTPSQTPYTLTNTGTASLDWQATTTQDWVTVNPANGTLATGASVSVAVAINAAANSLAQGTYSDTITFTNKTNGAGTTTRTVTLTIQPGAGGGVLYVDDDAPGDPGPDNPSVSDPAEDGSEQHPYDSIQQAIDAASNGQTVIVLPGVYTGSIDLSGKAITLNQLSRR